MSIIDFLVPQKKKVPTITGYSLWGSVLQYDLSFDVYYKYYNLNPYIFMAINKRKGDAFSKGWELTKGTKDKKGKNKGKVTLYNEDMKELIKYSTSGTPKEFYERLIRDYDVTGNAYIYIVKDEWGEKDIGMQILDPRYIKPVSNKQWRLLGYIQNLDWIKVFLPSEVYHIKDDNDIKNEVSGKSRMTSLFLDVETDQEARESNLAFFKNNQTPSSIVLLDSDFQIEEDDEAAYKKKIKDIFESGKYEWGKNHHRSLMAQWIKDVIKVQDKISDMEYKELRTFTGDLVFWVYETPKSILWFTESTNYSNGLNQYDLYWDNIEALEQKFSVFLTEVLKRFDDQYVFTALKDNLRKLMLKAEIAGNLYKEKGIITLNESRALIQYDEVTDWDKFFESKWLTIWETKTEK